MKNLNKKYKNFTVLKNINLKIKKGEIYALMGPNGSGKTTLASIIASVRKPTSGKIKIFNKSPEISKNILGYIPQENFSIELLSGKENLLYFAKLLGYSKTDAKQIVNDILEKIGLSSEANKKVFKYSGGMRKKLEIATAFFPEIKILILDEPTTGLDPSARRNFFGFLEEFKENDTTILLITHIGQDAEMADRIGLMYKGEIIAEGTPDELKEKSGIKTVINLDIPIKNDKILSVLKDFSEHDILETELGYRLYSKEAEYIIPDIVRRIDQLGYKILRIEIIKPSIEDVFFKLTGKSMKEAE